MKTRKRKQPSILPMLALAAGGVLLLVAAALFLAQGDSNVQPTQLPSAAANDHEDAYAEIERVMLADARSALDTGSAIFVDVRAAEVYAASHIPDALSIPSAELETRLNELDPNAWIITYCT